jgi:hypothetical protein
MTDCWRCKWFSNKGFPSARTWPDEWQPALGYDPHPEGVIGCQFGLNRLGRNKDDICSLELPRNYGGRKW